MAHNVNSNAVVAGKVHTIQGVECVKWNADSFVHETLTAERFKELSGNDISFLKEWAVNRYPIFCNDWMLTCIASHIGNDGVHSVQFLVNNAVVPLLTNTFGGMLLTAQNGTVSCEIVNIP